MAGVSFELRGDAEDGNDREARAEIRDESHGDGQVQWVTYYG